MPEKSQQQIRQALKQLETTATPHILQTSRQVWLRLHFRLTYRPRGGAEYNWHTGDFLAALYVLAFLVWTTESGWLGAGLLAVVASAVAVVAFLFLYTARGFRS